MSLITELSDKRPNKAPVVIFDRNELGDKRLDAKENLAKLKEENLKFAEKSRLPDQTTLENRDMALGHPMAYQDLIRLLSRMNSRLIFEDGGVRNAIAVRYPGHLEDGTYGKRYITGFYKETMPEFSCVLSDERGRPTRECRGWRTVVAQIVRQGIVSYKDAVDVFGEPSGQRSGRWMELLRDKRN